MKRFLLIFLIVLSADYLFAQVRDTIEVSFTKSAFLLFDERPFFQVGSEDVIVQVIDEDKLMIQAGLEGFEETNLFVRVGDKMMVLILQYTNSPKKYLYDLRTPRNTVAKTKKKEEQAGQGKKPDNVLVDYAKSEKKMKEKLERDSLLELYHNNCIFVLNRPRSVKDKGVVDSKIQFYLQNMYVFGDKFYFHLVVKNSSKIDYYIDFIRFRIDNIKTGIKKAADQIIDLEPVYVFNDSVPVVRGKSYVDKIFVFDQFTIDDNKHLVIDMWELNGDRKLMFDLKNEDVLKIKEINE